MAREATKYLLRGTNNDGDPISFIIASSATVTKGAILKFADPFTASASTGTGDPVAGIASMDKAADYSTSISVWTDGIFKVTASGAVTAGVPLVTAAPGNYLMAGGSFILASGAAVVGYALETAAADETFLARIKL